MCKSKLGLRVDTYRNTGRENNTCKCDGYHFPHARARGWCYHADWTAEDMQKRIEG